MAVLRRAIFAAPARQFPQGVLPSFPIEIDPDNPLSAGLIAAFPLNGSPNDLAGNNTAATTGGTAAWAQTSQGPALFSGTAPGYASVANAAVVGSAVLNGPFSMSCWVYATDVVHTACLFFGKEGASVSGPVLVGDELFRRAGFLCRGRHQ